MSTNRFPALNPHAPGAYRICTRCVMDTSDPELTFDEQGICHRCKRYDDVIANYTYKPEIGWPKLHALAERIREEGKGKPYDCVIGLSGGVDSTFVAHLVKKKLGLRPIAIHLDNGWNTEIAVHNIENVVKILGIDLYTHVIDWEEFRDLQKAFLRSSTPDSEVPTDHAIVSLLYQMAARQGIRYVIGGSNYQTEQMVPYSWSYGHSDWKYIKGLNDAFGGRRLATYPHDTQFHRKWLYPYVKKIQVINVLNYIDYKKERALELMKSELGWVSYGDKHHESIYTRFYQTYILPRKFGADKRRPHLSCLINNGEMTRQQALHLLQQPTLDEEQMERDREFVIKKLGFSPAEFETIMTAKPKGFWDYPSYERDPPFYDAVFNGMLRGYYGGRALASRGLAVANAVARLPYRAARKALRLIGGGAAGSKKAD